MSRQESVEIESELMDKLESRVPQNGFNSADDFAAYIIEEVVLSIDDKVANEESDREVVRDQLSALGYLDE